MQQKRETMQATQERKATQNAIRIMSALTIVTWLGAGCGKADKIEPPAPEATHVPKAVETEKWEPQTVTPSKAPSDQGHEGHDHGPGGHTH